MSLKRLFPFLLALGLLLRLFFSLTTFHRDLSALTTSSQVILFDHHWFDFYDAVLGPDKTIQSSPYQTDFIYHPLAYLIPNLLYLPFKPILAPVVDSLHHFNPAAISGRILLPQLLIYKLPLLLSDLLILLLLPRFFTSVKRGRQAQLLWALNPAAIYVSSIIGQIDILLTLFLVLALLALKRRQPTLASVFLGLSALVKPTALLALPLLVLAAFNPKPRLKPLLGSLSGLGVYLLGILPFLSSLGFRQHALFAAHLQKTIFAGISISPGYAIPWFFIALSLIYLNQLTRRTSLMLNLGATIFASLAFTHFHPQWFVWLTPWLLLPALKHRRLWLFYLPLAAWVVILASFGPQLHLNTFLAWQNLRLTLPPTLTAQLQPLILLSRAWLVAVFILEFLFPQPLTKVL